MLYTKLIYRRVPDLKVLARREVHKSYYDLLGLTPKASQIDIKNAYYKKSMLYHPDKGEGNPERFREITTAYEILGNLKLRQMYDKGLLPSAPGFSAIPKPDPVTNKPDPPKHPIDKDKARANQHFYENVNSQSFDESVKKKQKLYTGKTAQYDFDAWTHAHYKEAFTKKQTAKRFNQEKSQTEADLKKADALATALFFLLVGYVVFFQRWATDGQDVYRPFKPKDQ